MARPGPPAALLALLLALSLSACGEGGPPAESSTAAAEESTAAAVEFTDAAGRVHRMDTPATRVVSLVPSATETLDALGARGVLVGRTDFDAAPWARDLPSVGGGIQPSYETLISLEPDLVVRFAGEQDAETPGVLDRMGIRHVAIRPDGIDDVRDAILMLGLATGRSDRAEALVADLDARLQEVRRKAGSLPHPRVAYVLGGTPPWVAGPGTFVHEVLEAAGGTNVFADLDRLYAAVSPEELVVRELDLILTPAASSVPDWLARRAEVREVGDLLELPGPGVGAAAEEIARILHGEAWR